MNPEIFSTKLEDKNLEDLTQTLLKELDNNKKDISILHQLAFVYKKTNELVKAVNIYITILELDPENEVAIYEKDVTQAIVAQSQLDIYGCTDTHMDPWT